MDGVHRAQGHIGVGDRQDAIGVSESVGVQRKKNEFLGIGPPEKGVPGTLALTGRENFLALLFEKGGGDFCEREFGRSYGQVLSGGCKDRTVGFSDEKFHDDGTVEIHGQGLESRSSRMISSAVGPPRQGGIFAKCAAAPENRLRV